MKATFQSTLDTSQGDLPSWRIGSIPAGAGTPNASVVVESEGRPLRRIDLYRFDDDCVAFQDAIIWQGFVVIGFGNRVYLHAIESGETRTYDLGSYFGHVYPVEDSLLVASAERITRIGPEGSIVWISEPVGLDGVLVDRIVSDVIVGQGEGDPPGGWRAFRLSGVTGALLPVDQKAG